VGQLKAATYAALLLALALAACAKPTGGAGGGEGLPSDALDQAIGGSIGDPTTCVIIAERSSHRVLYTYGQRFNCVRGLPACDRPGFLTAQQALTFADTPDGRGASCPSNADQSRSVGWAEGRIASSKRDLIFSAVMEGERALPGHEMMARLADAFGAAGI
jgi:hypothetical protein